MDPLLATLLQSVTGTAEPDVLAIVGALLLARLLPVVLLTPWARPNGVGWLVAALVIATLWTTLLPLATHVDVMTLPRGLGLVFSCLREVVLGAAFALVARLPLEAMQWAGHLSQRASGELDWNVRDAAPLVVTYRWFALVLFVALGGCEFALTALADTLALAPLGGSFATSSVREVVWTFVGLCASAVSLGLVLAMPVLLGTFLVDVAHAVMSRWLSRWPSSQQWLPIKHVVALSLALLSLSFVASALPDVYETSITHARSMLTGSTP